MKRSNLYWGLAFIAAGLGFLAAALLPDTPLTSLFCGFAGAFGVSGLIQVMKYIKWTRPKNREAYARRLEEEQIELRDERKELLRCRAGRCAYVLGLVLCAAAIVAFSVLDALGLLACGRILTLTLAVLLIVQYAAGLAIYRLLSRKY